MSQTLARAVSILGHPMLVLPLTVMAVAAVRGEAGMLATMAIGFGLFAAVVMAYSWLQVKRGRWGHVDASQRKERSALNRFLLVALLASTLLALVRSWPHELVLGLGLSAALVAFALLTARWCKLSLHLTFVVFASLLLCSISWWAGAAALAFAAAVAWSRLRLQRHVRRDLLAGAAAGAVAGTLWLVASPSGMG